MKPAHKLILEKSRYAYNVFFVFIVAIGAMGLIFI